MEYTFSKVKDAERNIHYGWMLHIKYPEELMCWMMDTEGKFSNDVWSLAGALRGDGHATGGFAGFEMMEDVLLKRIKNLNGKTNIIDLASFCHKLKYESKLKCLAEGYEILVNQNDGFFPMGDNIEILETKTSKNLVWPSSGKISITKWPEGKHWYAKVDNTDVVDADGNQKWNTKKEAQKQAEIFRDSV